MANSFSSSAQHGRNLPLVDCPDCRVQVIRCKSKSNNFYYRCQNRCGKWWFEDAYELYLLNNHASLFERSFGGGATAAQASQHAAGSPIQGLEQPGGDLKMLAFDLKMQLGEIKQEIVNLKSEVKEFKDELNKAKEPTLLDNAPVVVFLAIFVVILMAVVWSK